MRGQGRAPRRKHGQGRATEQKQDGLFDIFHIGLTILRASDIKYFHFDLNSGPGWNEEVGCQGSPLVFLAAAAKVRHENYHAILVDKDSAAIEALRERPEVKANLHRCSLRCEDHGETIRGIPRLLREMGQDPTRAFGSVYCDPNGSEVPIDDLVWLAKQEQCPKLDIILNWNSAAVKRIMGRFGRGRRLREVVKSIDKKQWLIRRPLDNWQFTLLVGRNCKTREMVRKGFYDIDGPMGEEFLNVCNHTREELVGMFQGVLPL